MLTKKLIVLGGSGFLGSEILNLLHKKKLSNFKIFCGDLYPPLKKNDNFIQINILNRLETKKILKDFNVVINCTGQVSNNLSDTLLMNTEGIVNIADSISLACARFIQISSVAVYGTIAKCSELSPINPEKPYGVCKTFAESILKNKIKSDNLTILRLSNLYGNGQKKGLFAYILQSFFSDRKLHFNNNGNLVRSFIHVKDCSEMILKFINDENLKGTYNIVGSQIFILKELIKKFENMFKIKFQKQFENNDPWENINSFDQAKIESSINMSMKYEVFDYFNSQINGKIKND